MSIASDAQARQATRSTETQYDVVVLGAGPYGLSCAAHLQAQGLHVAVFGKPISFWREHMPQGMLLRSYWWATTISDPQGRYSFARYFQEKGVISTESLSIETFIDYGLWFQRSAVSSLDETYIEQIQHVDGRFLVQLVDGRVVWSNTVVMAPGLLYYAHIPEEYRHLPLELVSHASVHKDLSTFAGQTVAIIGGGQAALESAALLSECGAEVHVIMRKPLRWTSQGNNVPSSFYERIRLPQAGMGRGWLNLLLERFPYGFQHFPTSIKDHILATRHGPAVAPWLRPRLFGRVTVHESTSVIHSESQGGRLQLTLSDGQQIEAEQLIACTGYRVDIQRLSMLHPTLLQQIQCYRDAPLLNSHFGSSVPGLYFVGASAARSFGPFYRFVIGNEAAACRVTQAIKKDILRIK